MLRSKKLQKVVFAILFLYLITAVPVYADHTDDLQTEAAETSLTDSPKLNLQNGWNYINKTWYYGENGNVKTGWLKWKGNWYYLTPGNGAMKTGWYEVKGKWYYSKSSGVMLSNGWKKIDQKWYYLSKNGDAKTGWLKWKGDWYYLAPGNGVMKTGWYEVKGKWYYSKSSGVMLSNGWKKIDQKWYYLSKNGDAKTGWLKWKDDWYYLTPGNGAMKTGWYKVGKKWYCSSGSGAMKSGWIKSGDKWYYLGSANDGSMKSGWITLSGKTYYLGGPDDGAMKTGWITLSGITYFLKSSGEMASDEWMGYYYFKPSGETIDTSKSEKGIMIAIDAGHQRYQNKDKEPIGPGSSVLKQKVSSGTAGVSTRLDEYELNLTVSLKLANELMERGYGVYMIRSTHDVNISNMERAKLAASSGADILFRVHANGDNCKTVHGALTMSPTSENPYLSSSLIQESQSLSKCVLDEYCKATGAKQLEIDYRDDMSGINWSTIPVTIIEMGYMSNPTEDEAMATASYQKKMVQGMVNGIEAYFN